MDTDRIKNTARLAGIELTEDEAIEFAGQLGSVLELFAGIERIDVEGVEPLATRALTEDELRRDNAVEGFAPVPEAIIVPRVLKEGR